MVALKVSSPASEILYMDVLCRCICTLYSSSALCFDTIEKMRSVFLWSGSPTQTHKAKVNLKDLCYPKEEGGLRGLFESYWDNLSRSPSQGFSY